MKITDEKPLRSGFNMKVPRRVAVTSNTLVQSSALLPRQSLPLMFTPITNGVDLGSWVAGNRSLIEQELAAQGGLLFRGFKVESQADFESFVDAIAITRMHYLEGATPRRELGRQVYSSTEFSHEHRIALHNELSYTMTWPMKIAFCCLRPASSGGETPLADMRRVLARIPPIIRERFEEFGWMLVRNYGAGLGLPWESVFRTTSKQEVELYCRQSAIAWEWRDGTQLRTSQIRPAIINHPIGGDPLWFNHIAFWHASSLDPETRRMLVSSFGDDRLPYNTYYGNGQVIEDDVIAEINRAYDSETILFPWRKGDVIYLDNMLIAHGRSPFSGDRTVIVSMGDPYTRADVDSRPQGIRQ